MIDMGVNKVNLANGETLIDLTSDTVTPETLAEGYTAHNSNGERIVGEMTTEGGESVSDVFWVTGEVDPSRMIATSVSHTRSEIEAAINSGKIVIASFSVLGLGMNVFGNISSVIHGVQVGFSTFVISDAIYYLLVVVGNESLNTNVKILATVN